jgi:hypothetical protein
MFSEHMITITLSAELFLELQHAAAECRSENDQPMTPADFAREAIESVLASRRLERLVTT